MEKKMTSGEIAKKVGISQKAVRLYDEKGLLKPTDYSGKDYDLVIAHYLDYELENPELLIERASKVLSKDGVFSINGGGVNHWYFFAKDAFENLGIDAKVWQERITHKTEKRDAYLAMLKKYFGEVESVMLPNKHHYEKPEEIIETLKRVIPSNEKLITKYQDKLTEYFAKIIEQKGEIVVDIESQFWHCKKIIQEPVL